jgi:hypothetical protein
MYDCMQLGKGRHCLIAFHLDILFKVLMQGVYVGDTLTTCLVPRFTLPNAC